MKRPILPAIVAIVCLTGASAQEKPNFAGKWRATGSFTVWTITVKGATMTVTQTVAGNSESTEYFLDGRPSTKTIEGPNGPVENVSTSTWEGDVLVTATKTGFGHTIVEKRWLEPDGTMRVQNSISFPGKPSPPRGPALEFKKIGD